MSSVEMSEAPKGSSVNKGRWEFLDAMRGVAAMLVVLQHGTERWVSWFGQWTADYFSTGTMGVVAFFLVSGFIIPVSIERAHSLKQFWKRRFLRLAPMFYVSFLGYLALQSFRPDVAPPLSTYPHLLRFLVGNLLLVQDAAHVPYALVTYWTLSYEVFFYFLCSVLFAAGLLSRSRLWAWLSLATFLAANVAAALRFHHTLSAGRVGVVVLAFSATVCYRYSKGLLRLRDVLLLLPALFAVYGVVFWLHYSVYPVVVPGEAFTRSALGTNLSWIGGLLLFALFFCLRRFEFPRWLLWLGRISYSLYLVHGLVLGFLPKNLSVWIGMPILVALSLAISHVTFKYIEQPAMDLGRHA